MADRNIRGGNQHQAVSRNRERSQYFKHGNY